MDADLRLETEVRELIRQRGLDPAREPEAFTAVIKEAIADYERRSTLGAVPHLSSAVSAEKSVRDAIVGFGPLQQYFDNPEVEEIWINQPSKVFVARRGKPELTTTLLTSAQVRDLVERMLASTGRRLDLSSPFVDARLPDGSRLHVVIPSITAEHWAVNIRKFVARAHRMQDLVALGSLPKRPAEFLAAAVNSGLNVLVSGATGAGKTTMLNCLASAINPAERVVTCEEVFELDLPLRDVVSMQCRQANLEGEGEIPLRRLVKEALRMRPSRMVVGEVREAESLDMLLAMNSGLPGLCTIHANSARDAVTKLCTLPLLAGENVSSSFVVPTVASCVDLVIHLDLRPNGVRTVREIVSLSGRVENGVVEISELYKDAGDGLVRGDGYPPHPEWFARAGHDLRALLEGDAAWSS